LVLLIVDIKVDSRPGRHVYASVRTLTPLSTERSSPWAR
jgi:hypothetical protein